MSSNTQYNITLTKNQLRAIKMSIAFTLKEAPPANILVTGVMKEALDRVTETLTAIEALEPKAGVKI